MSQLEPLEKAYWLSKVCEENYERLFKLVPDLASLPLFSIAEAKGKPLLQLQLLEQSRYTLTLELSHCFGLESLMEPAVRIRVYLDARSAEVLCDYARPHVYGPRHREIKAREIMDYKWTLNYFLARWLEHCLAADYQFGFIQETSNRIGEAA